MTGRAYWERPLDIFKLIVALILLALLIALAPRPGPQAGLAASPAFTQPASGGTFAADELPTLEGTADPGVALRFFEGATLLGETTTGPDGKWRFTLPGWLAEGLHNLRAVVVDPAGRELAMSDPFALTIKPPAIAAVVPAITNLTSGASLNLGEPLAFEGVAAPGAKLRLFDRDTLLGETTAGPDGKWRFELPGGLSEGLHNLRVAVFDRAGKELVASEPFALTIKPPAVSIIVPTITSPARGASLKVSELLALEGTAAPGAKLRLFDGDTLLGETTAGPDGKWRFELLAPLAAGEHSLRVAVYDTAGNEVTSSSPLVLSLLRAATIPTFSLPEMGVLAPGGVFEGVADPGARLLIYAGETLLGEVTAGPDSRWSFQLPADLKPGQYAPRLVVVDEAGQVLAESESTSVQVVEPALPVTGGR